MVLEFEVVDIENPETYEIIIGQGNFTVKTIDDLHVTLASAVPNLAFGVAMNESKPQLVRMSGTNEELTKLASETAKKIAAGHIFVIYIKGAYPINVLPAIKSLPCVCMIYVATSNPLQVIVAKTQLGRSIIGCVDGLYATRIETEKEKEDRKKVLVQLGFTPG
jgi:hypothetical protein